MTSTALRLENTRRAIARRIVEHIRNDTSDLGAAPMLNHPSVYTDPARHALERQKLFRETPLVVCLSADLAEPGSFRTFDEAGVPIFVVRDVKGQVRAYLNICVHRGARLVRSRAGAGQGVHLLVSRLDLRHHGSAARGARERAVRRVRA